MDESPTPDLLHTYLAGHDAACPACGYNVRGMSGTNCPECGRKLALGIREAGFGPRRGLLLLIFGLLLVVGGARAYQVCSGVYGAGWSSPQTFFVSMLTPSGGGAGGRGGGGAGGAGGAGGGGGGGSGVGFGVQPMPRTRIVGPQAVNPSWDISRVGVWQGIAAGWWVLVAFTAGVALVFVAMTRRQTISRRRQVTLATIAWLGAVGVSIAMVVEAAASV